jgi:hypothetical protein
VDHVASGTELFSAICELENWRIVRKVNPRDELLLESTFSRSSGRHQRFGTATHSQRLRT